MLAFKKKEKDKKYFEGKIVMKSKTPLDFEKLDTFTIGGYAVGYGAGWTWFDWNNMEGKSTTDEEGYMYITCELDDFALEDKEWPFDLDQFLSLALSKQLVEVFYEAMYDNKFVNFNLDSFKMTYSVGLEDPGKVYEFSKENIQIFNEKYNPIVTN